MQFNRIVKSLMIVAGAAVAFSSAHGADITGAGATFPYPIYAKWAEAYKKTKLKIWITKLPYQMHP